MGILQVQNINLSFGDRTLLSDVSFTLGEHCRAALAGGNGEGKSTLMKIIANIIAVDSGIVTKTRDMTVSYLPQSDIVLRENTVYNEIETAFNRYKDNLQRQSEIENLLTASTEGHDRLLAELNKLQEEILNSPYYNRKAIIYRIAQGLGFKAQDLDRQCNSFSGGFQMRIALAKVLASNPDLMLLDEPTNYLDIEARLWLKNFLKTYNGSLLIVCHDKGFMDDTVNIVFELFNSHISKYNGNYTFYEKQRRLEIQQLENTYKKQQEEIEKTEEFIERFRYKATKAKQVQSRVKQLEKIEPVIVPSHLKTLSFSFPQPPHSPNDVVVIDNLTKIYNSNTQNELKVFNNFSINVAKSERLAVTGHNGIGKSTLLRIIAQCDSDFSGTCRLGNGVKVGYYAQDTADSLTMTNTILEEVIQFGSESQMRSALGAFLFSGDDIYKKVSVLSGGERSRLALLKILLNPVSLLILDEPTNHLDINSKDMLLKALQEYQGTIIFVSHDSYFIKGIANRILYLSESQPEIFNGDYEYFEWKLNQRLEIEENKTSENVSLSKTETKIAESPQNNRQEENRKRNRMNKLKRELESLIQKLTTLEDEIKQAESELNLPENYSDITKSKQLQDKIHKLEQEKSQTEEQWLELEEQIAN